MRYIVSMRFIITVFICFSLIFSLPLICKESGSGYDRPAAIAIDIEMSSGWAFWSLKDFDLSKKYFDKMDEMSGFSASTKTLAGSLIGTIDLRAGFLKGKQEFGLRLGYRYMPGGDFRHRYDDGITFSKNTLTMSAHGFYIYGFYLFPLLEKSSLSVMLACGADFIISRIHYDYTAVAQGIEFYNRGDLRDSGIGAGFEVGIEKMVFNNFYVKLNCSFNFIRLDDFSGMISNPEGTSKKMRLTMIKEDQGEMISIFPCGEVLGDNVRKAVVEGGGLKINIGIIYRFPVNIF